ncbi:hypothetical protein JRQ81_006038 [Phrynocephalus forsythii]|uniref:Uncharacterized protein n=1 Tax=Phrynocephalus forsythii TaxID=171643 RepID=A0A9Q0XHV9_9SAUR|nr:hypothetical protein JRQ81_006038 [Phrynocephalus forsythii]
MNLLLSLLSGLSSTNAAVSSCMEGAKKLYVLDLQDSSEEDSQREGMEMINDDQEEGAERWSIEKESKDVYCGAEEELTER